VPLQPRHFMHGDVIDEIRLPGFKRRKARRVFRYFAKNDLFDIRLAAPIVVVPRENKIPASLVAHIFIRPGAYGILVHLIAIFISGRLAQNEAILQTVQKHRQGLLGHENNRLIIGCLHFRDVLKIRRLQAAAFLVPHPIDGKSYVLGSKRRAVVKFDALFQANNPPLALVFPRLGENTDVVFAFIIVFDQRFHNMLPVAVNRAGAVPVRMQGIGDARMINRNPILGRGEGIAGDVRSKQRSRAQCGARF